jgi:hypothetical protein
MAGWKWQIAGSRSREQKRSGEQKQSTGRGQKQRAAGIRKAESSEQSIEHRAERRVQRAESRELM